MAPSPSPAPATPSAPGAALRGTIDALPDRQRDLLAVLALAGPRNISRLAELAAAAGVRESPARQYSTAKLRQVLDELRDRHLVTLEQTGHGSGDEYGCTIGVRFAALRVAARRRTLDDLVQPLRRRLYPQGMYAFDRAEDATLFDARVALARLEPAGLGVLGQLQKDVPLVQLAVEVVIPALSPFDDEWFGALPVEPRKVLLEVGLAAAEAIGVPLRDLCHHLEAHLDLLADSPGALAALGGLAVARGDFGAARRIAAAPGGGETTRGVAGAVALLDGKRDEALSLFAGRGKKPRPLAGLPGLLHVYALFSSGNPANVEEAHRLATARARPRGEPLRQSYAYLAAVTECLREPSRVVEQRHVLTHDPARDTYSPLVRAHFALWFDAPDFERAHAVAAATELARISGKTGNLWLYEQYAGAAHALGQRLGANVKYPRVEPPPAPASVQGVKLWELRTERDSWELALEGLEHLSKKVATSTGPEGAPLDQSERLIWRVRVYGLHFQVEPYLQKRSGAGFTKGRALALKHLVPDGGADRGPGGSLLRRLPEEDASVAAFVRQRREMYGAYPQTISFFAPGVFRALVGHPRVFLGDDTEPVEVALGTVQVAARARGDRVHITVEPEGLHEEIVVRREDHRLVVYEVPETVRALVKLVGTGLSLPESARRRALDALGGLSHLVVVQSTEGGTGRSVPPDSTPWLRLVPRGGALSLSVRVRPLGEGGPELLPGRGAVTLVGRSNGETLQTERDLEAERRLAREALVACGLPDDTAPAQSLTVDDPEACLELVAALRALGPAVHVEWPEGMPFRLRARAGRKQLRGKLSSGVDFFLATGSLVVEEDLSVDLEELLALVAERPGRFVRLGTGEYVELEQELRDLLDSVSAARTEGRPGAASKQRGITIPKAALPVLERLTEDKEDGSGSAFELDADTATFRDRLLAVTGKRFRVPRTLQAELRPYQMEGFEWLCRLAELELGACLADDMGLGKTVQLIALLLHRRKVGPALVVAPTSVCDNWHRELARFAPSLDARAFVGPGRETALESRRTGTVIVTSYAILQQDAELLATLPFATIILDEAQLVKNAESQRARAAFALQGAFRVVATGTPVENHVGDLHSLFRFALPGLLGTFPAFNRRFGKNLTGEAGAGPRRALRRLIQPFVLRRTKSEVLDDLPPLTEIQHSVTLGPDEARFYEAVRRSALDRLASVTEDPRSRVQILAEITRLRRLCCHPSLAVDAPGVEGSKIAAFLELVTELVEGRHRALVFSQFVDMLTLVRAALDRKGITYQYLDGSTPAKDRTAAVDAFQAGEGDVFLISLRAGGFGLNLTAADYVIHLDPWWNPAVESQASDRAHRIGQTRPVTVYRLVATGTVEERIVELHKKKRELADTLLDDTGKSATLSVDELRSLLDGG